MSTSKGKSWNKLRFDWKKLVAKCPRTSRGAKHLASHLCDTYVGRNTGECWPSNATLADDFNVSKRTIQRYLRDLMQNGWLAEYRRRNGGRGLRLLLPPWMVKSQTKAPLIDPAKKTNLSRSRDSTVTHYKNQRDNQVTSGVCEQTETLPRVQLLPCVTIHACEQHLLEKWMNWIKQETSFDPPHLLRSLKSPSGYQFPCRHPREDDDSKVLYLNFFEKFMKG